MSRFSCYPDLWPRALLLQPVQPHCHATLRAYGQFSALSHIIPPSTFPKSLLPKHLQPHQTATHVSSFLLSISFCCPGWILLLYPLDKATACMIESLPPPMRLAANLIWELFIPSWYLPLTTIKVELSNWDSQHPLGTCLHFSIWLLIVWFYLFTSFK